MLACIKKSLKNGFDFVLKFVNQLIFYIPSMILLLCKVVSDTCMTSKKAIKARQVKVSGSWYFSGGCSKKLVVTR